MLAIGAVIGAGHLRRDRHGRRRPDRSQRRSDPVRRGPGAGVLVHPPRRRLRARGPLLRGARGDDPAGRQRLRLFVRDARRAGRVDHRLGPDPRVRGRQRRGRDLVGRLLHHAAARVRHRAAGLPDDRLPHGAAQLRSRRSTACSTRRRACSACPFLVARAGVRDRDADHLAAAARRARERDGQQHHGRDQADGARRSSSPSARRTSTRTNYRPFAPNGFTRHPSGRGDRVLRLHRLRRDLDRGRGNEEPAAQPADRHPRRPGRSAR